MNGKIVIHAIHPLAQHTNRGQDGEPKMVPWGGQLRSRVSSQCWKRAMRMQMAESLNIGTRTRHVLDLLIDAFYDQDGTGKQEAVREVFARLVSETLSRVNEDGNTDNTLYLGSQEIEKAVSLVQEANLDLQGDPDEWDIESLAESWSTYVEVAPVPADVACFGRMVAADPERWNVEAAVQVAHAVATHRLQSEIDYFAAVDDVEERASYLGTQDLQTAVFYRFIALDVSQLLRNLGGDIDLTHRTVRKLLESIAVAVPEGGLSNSGHYNRPELFFAQVRTSQPINLLSAFDPPVRAGRGGLAAASVRRLEQYLMEQEAAWGMSGIRGQYAVIPANSTVEVLEGDLRSCRVDDLDTLITHTLEDVGV